MHPDLSSYFTTLFAAAEAATADRDCAVRLSAMITEVERAVESTGPTARISNQADSGASTAGNLEPMDPAIVNLRRLAHLQRRTGQLSPAQLSAAQDAMASVVTQLSQAALTPQVTGELADAQSDPHVRSAAVLAPG